MQNVLVVVYGTLMTGEPNAHVAADALCREPCVITGTLYDTNWGFPAFVPEGDTRVKGELLEVTAATLAAMDRLEGYPGFYDRSMIDVQLPDGSRRQAWVYIMRHLPEQARAIPGGAWSDTPARTTRHPTPRQ
ncbi:MAG: gamma-glutamylcyclotransferase family protein [Kiritimatiellia bacterium]